MSLSHSPSIVTNGLVLALDAANTKSYPGSGTAWNDLSGNGYSGTLTNGPTFSSSENGSIVFNGSNQYIIGPSISSQFTGNMTAEIWVKITSTPVDFVRLIGTGINGGGARTFGLWLAANRRLLWQRSAGVDPAINPTDVLPLGSWNHIVATTSGSSHSLYLNGVSIGTNTAAGPWTASGQDISIAYGYLHAYLNGNISNAKLYSRALSQTEVSQNFNAQRGRYGL
jgi:hypothetical protein